MLLAPSRECVSPFALRLPSTLPLLSLVTDIWAPHDSPIFSPPAPPQIPTAPGHVRRPALSLEMPYHHVNSPTLISPLKTLFNQPPTINGVNALTPTITSQHPPPRCSLGSNKRQAQATTNPELSLTLFFAHAKLELPPIFITVTLPLLHHSCSGEPCWHS
jgi:hypothetical protein